MREAARRLLNDVSPRDWPPGLIATIVALERGGIQQDGYASRIADIVQAWVWEGADAPLEAFATLKLLDEKPWIAEMEVEEAARRAVEMAKRAEMDAARAEVAKITINATPIEVAAAIMALQKQMDWLIEKIRTED